MPQSSEDDFPLDEDLRAVADSLQALSASDRDLERPPESIWDAIQAETASADTAADTTTAREQPRVLESEKSLVRQGVAAEKAGRGVAQRTPGASSHGSAVAAGRGGADDTDIDLEALTVAYEATRAILQADSAAELSAALADAVRRLGGTVGPADVEGGDVLPIDVSLGEGEPLLPRAEQFSLARMRLEALLPTLVEDARRMLTLLE